MLANNSSRALVAPLVAALEDKGVLAGPLCTDIGMGGGEAGLLKAADAAADAAADIVVTVGGGAVQDAGKLIRLWLAGRSATSSPADAGSPSAATPDGIRAVTSLDPLPALPPQICCPNSFAMAELTSVAGMTLSSGVKSGASHPAMMPTTTIFDPALAAGLPDWVRFGTALRCVEHAVGAATHPDADEGQKAVALEGLRVAKRGIEAMVADPTSKAAAADVYAGGWCTVRALNTNGCYPSIGHLVQNMYAAKYDVHQGSCSGVLCARILAHHADASKEAQDRIATVLGGEGTVKSAGHLVTALVVTLPGVAREHADAGVDVATLQEFCDSRALDRFNKLSPKPFADAGELHAMLTRPLDQL